MNSENPNPTTAVAVDATNPTADDLATAAAVAENPSPEVVDPAALEADLRAAARRAERLRSLPGRGGEAATEGSVQRIGGRGQLRGAGQGASRGMGQQGNRQGPIGVARADEPVAETQAPVAFAPPSAPVPLTPRPQPERPSAPPVSVEAQIIRPPAVNANLRPRHRGVLALAFLLIVVPTVLAGAYLWKFAVDQYVSVAGFAIRTESASSPFDILGAFGGGSTTTSKDMDILDNFITSQQLVQKIDKELNIRAMYSKPTNDPLYTYDTSGTIEDLVKYWNRMVIVNYDNTTGLMQLYVYAFTPEDAQKVAQAVLDESSAMINHLASITRDDTTIYAKQALDAAEAKLKEARGATTKFRIENNILDPEAQVQGQSSVLASLTQQLVASQIEQQVYKQGAIGDNDPRLTALQTKINVIQNRIAEEEAKVGVANGSTDKGYAEIMATYTTLKVDEDFSQKAYLTALASYDAAVMEAQHKQVYIANYEEPTVAEASTAPNRWLILAAVMLIGFLTWSIVTLVYYALRDRR